MPLDSFAPILTGIESAAASTVSQPARQACSQPPTQQQALRNAQAFKAMPYVNSTLVACCRGCTTKALQLRLAELADWESKARARFPGGAPS